MNENFLIFQNPFEEAARNKRIYRAECAITSTIERDKVPVGSCLMYGELSTLFPDYELRKKKWNQPTTAREHMDR